jgi:hypothetical protein
MNTRPDTPALKNFIQITSTVECKEPLDEELRKSSKQLADITSRDQLSIGLVGEAGRKPEQWGNELIELLSEEVELTPVVATRKSFPASCDHDTWVLVTSANQLGSLFEKEFVERLGPEIASDMIVLITDVADLAEEESDEVMAYAQKVFGERGVTTANILPYPSSETSRLIVKHFEDLQDRVTALREIIIRDVLDRLSHSLDASNDELMKLVQEIPDLDEFEQRVQLARERVSMFQALVDDQADDLASKLGRELSRFLDSTSQTSTSAREAELVLRGINRWVERDLPQVVDQHMSALLEDLNSRLGSEEDELDGLLKARPWQDAGIANAVPVGQFQLLLDQQDDSQLLTARRLTVLAVGAIIGAALPVKKPFGPLLGALGATAGSELITHKQESETRELRQENLTDAIEKQLDSKLSILARQATQRTSSAIRTMYIPQIRELEAAADKARDRQGERKDARDQLEDIGRLRDQLAQLSTNN